MGKHYKGKRLSGRIEIDDLAQAASAQVSAAKAKPGLSRPLKPARMGVHLKPSFAVLAA